MYKINTEKSLIYFCSFFLFKENQHIIFWLWFNKNKNNNNKYFPHLLVKILSQCNKYVKYFENVKILENYHNITDP